MGVSALPPAACRRRWGSVAALAVPSGTPRRSWARPASMWAAVSGFERSRALPEQRRVPGSPVSVAPRLAMVRRVRPPLSPQTTSSAGAEKPNSWISPLTEQHHRRETRCLAQAKLASATSTPPVIDLQQYARRTPSRGEVYPRTTPGIPRRHSIGSAGARNGSAEAGNVGR